MYVAAIIAAGGRGVRLGADRPKQFLEIRGRSILELSIKALAASDRIDEIVVALPEDHLDAVARSFQGQIKQPLHFVAGGERRQDSVANAFAKTSERADVVVIHDAARPFVTTDVIDRAIDGALEYGAAIAAVTVSDTVKQTGDANAQGSRRILATIPATACFLRRRRRRLAAKCWHARWPKARRWTPPTRRCWSSASGCRCISWRETPGT